MLVVVNQLEFLILACCVLMFSALSMNRCDSQRVNVNLDLLRIVCFLCSYVLRWYCYQS